MMDSNGLYFHCRIADFPLTTFAVTEFKMRGALSTLFELTLTVTSDRSQLRLSEQLLQPASLTIIAAGLPQRTIAGLISGAERGKTGVRKTYYTITVRPPLWLLTLSQDSRIFHQQSVPQILQALMQKHRVHSDKKLYDPHQRREYVTQKRETDYQFFTRLAAEEGISFWSESTTEGKPLLFYSDSRLGMTGAGKFAFNPQLPSDEYHHVIIDVRFGVFMAPRQTILKDRDYHAPHDELKHYAFLDGDQPGDSNPFTLYDSYGGYQEHPEGQLFSQYRLEALRAESETGIATGCCIGLMPGKVFSIHSHPSEEINRRWQVVAESHHGRCPQAAEEESSEQGTTLHSEVRFVSSQTNWRPAFRRKPQSDGAEVATVVGPPGEEIYTNSEGAVRIHFHWNRYDKADDRASCWVRVAQGWNGNGYGFYAIPRIGQEVVITYLDGDIDRPLVTGCTYNGENRPPLDLPAEKTCTTFKTQTHKGSGFNELRFDDANGSEEVFIHAQKDKNIKIRNNRTITVDVDDDETVGGNQQILVKKNQDMEVLARQSVIVNGEQATTYRKSHTLSITEDFSETVKGNKTLTVEQNQAIKIVGQQNNQVEGSRFLDVAGDNTLSVGSNITITSKGGEVIIGNAGGRIVIDAIGNIRLEGLSITLDNHSAGKPGPVSKYLYSAQYLLTDQKTKQVRAYEPYSLKTAAGQVVNGFTNEFGQTRRVFTENEDEVELAIYERKKQPVRKLFHVTHGEMMEQTFEFVDTEESL
jgi:type VI secretion system secreted protein VgrG